MQEKAKAEFFLLDLSYLISFSAVLHPSLSGALHLLLLSSTSGSDLWRAPTARLEFFARPSRKAQGIPLPLFISCFCLSTFKHIEMINKLSYSIVQGK